MSRLPCALLGLLVWAGISPANADTFTAAQLGYDNAMLSQFNLINLGNYTTSNETEGRIVVGGNATVSGSTNVCFQSTCTGNTTTAIDSSAAKYGALTVFGNLSGNFNTGNNGGDINVRGTATGSYNLRGKGAFNIVTNGTGATVDSATTIRTTAASFKGTRQNSGAVQINQTLATVFPFGTTIDAKIGDPMKALSKGIAALPGSPGVTAQKLPVGNNVFLTANNDYTANGKKYGVVTTTLADLAAEQNFGGVNNGTNDATFVIVRGNNMDSTDASYNASLVLPNLNSFTGANKVIFDFVDAKVLKFAGTWSGSVLAPLATITQQGGVIDGSVVVASINQVMELHNTYLFTGDLTGLAGFTYNTSVPEPGTIWLLAAGAVSLAAARRVVRRRSKG